MRLKIFSLLSAFVLAGCQVNEWSGDIQNPAHNQALRSVSNVSNGNGLPDAGPDVFLHFVNSWVQDTSSPQTMQKVRRQDIEICRSNTGCNPPSFGSGFTCVDIQGGSAIRCRLSVTGKGSQTFTIYNNLLASTQLSDDHASENAGKTFSGVWYQSASERRQASALYDRLYRAYSDARNGNLETAVRTQQRQIDQTTAVLTGVAAGLSGSGPSSGTTTDENCIPASSPNWTVQNGCDLASSR